MNKQKQPSRKTKRLSLLARQQKIEAILNKHVPALNN